MIVYRLIEIIPGGVVDLHKPIRYFKDRESAEEIAEELYPEKEARDFFISIDELEVN